MAKGVLYRHFADFDTFLAELVFDRVARIERQAADLCDSAGQDTVVGNLTGALMNLFGSVAVAMVALVISRDDLRARLRQVWPTGVPVLTEATAMVTSYLEVERQRGRIAADADVDTLAPMVIGTGHLLFAGRDGQPPDPAALDKVVTAVLADVVRDRRP